jgi:hypothetical protein
VPDQNVDSSGFLHVEGVKGGTYGNVTLNAHGSGSIHAQEDLTVTGTLTLIAESSGTILLPKKVTCNNLVLTCRNSSQINSNDLEVSDAKATVENASTCGLYMVVSGALSGSVSKSSTLNTWIHWKAANRAPAIGVDSSSVFSLRDWAGP